MPTDAHAKGSMAWRIAKGALKLIGGLLLLVILLVGGALTFLSTERGGGWAVDKALSAANGAIPGEITVGRAEVDWLRRIELFDVALLTPEGERVAGADRILLRYALPPLLRRRVLLDAVELDAPSLALIADPEGVTNLDRALKDPDAEATPTPTPAEDSGDPLVSVIDAPHVQVRGGVFVQIDTAAEAPRVVALTALNLDAAYRYAQGGHTLEILPLTLSLQTPALGDVRLKTQAHLNLEGEGAVDLERLSLTAPGIALSGSGNITDLDHPEGRIAIEADPIEASALKVFAPALPLQGTYALTLTAEGRGEAVQVDGALTLPEGALRLGGQMDLSGLQGDTLELGYDLTLTGEGIQPAALYTEPLPPMSPLGFTLTAKGEGIDPQTLTADVALTLEGGEVEGYAYEGGAVTAALSEGIVALKALSLSTPYGDLNAAGRVDLDGPLSLDAQLKVPSLQALGERLGQDLRGRADVEITASGTMDAPEARFKAALGGVEILQGGEQSAGLKELTLKGDLALAEAGPKVSVEGSGAGLRSGSVAIEAFTLSGGYAGEEGEVKIEGHTYQDQPVLLSATVRTGEVTRIRARDLRLPVGQVSWDLQAPFGVRIAGARVEIDPFTIAAEGGQGEISGGGVFNPEGTSDLTLTARGVRLDPIGPLLGEGMERLRGTVGLDATVKGPAGAPDIRATVGLEGVAAASIPAMGGQLELRSGGKSANLRVALSLKAGGQLEGDVGVPLDITLTGAPTLEPRGALTGQMTLVGLDLRFLEPFMAPEDPEAGGGASQTHISGTVEAKLALGGSPAVPDVHLSAQGEEIRVAGDPMNAHLTLSLAGERLRVDGEASNPGADDAVFLTLKGEAPLAIGEDLAPQPRWEEPVDLQIRLVAPDARVLSPLVPELADVRGIVNADLKAAGRISDPELSLTLRGRRIRIEDAPEMNLDLEVAYAKGQAATLVRLKAGAQPISALDLRVKLALGDALKGGALNPRDLRVGLSIPSFDLAALPRSWRGGRLEGGILQASALALSPGPDPSFELEMAASDLTVTGTKAQDLKIKVVYADGDLTLEGRAYDDDRPALILDGRLPMAIRLPLGGAEESVFELGDGLTLDAELKQLNLALLNAFLPQDGWVAGEVSGALHARGSPKTPEIRGEVRLGGGRIYFPSYGVYYDPVTLTAAFTPEGVRLEELTLKGREGALRAKGDVHIVQDEPIRLDMAVRLSDFEAINGPPGRVVLRGSIGIEGTLDAPKIEGDITVPEGVIKLPDLRRTVVRKVVGIEASKALADTELPEGVWVLTDEAFITWETWIAGATAEEEAPFNLNADVRVTIPRDLWLRNDAGEIITEVKGDVHLMMEAGKPRMTGSIETIRGELNLFAEPMTIEQGEVTFTGGEEIDPRIDLLASVDTDSYGKVSLKMAGPLSDPELLFLSDRGYEPGDVVSILVVGRPLSAGAQQGDGNQVSSQVESIAAGVLSGWAQRKLADKTPLDYIEVRADGFSSADLRVGKYVTDKLFLTYQRKLDTGSAEEENVNEVRAEYRISDDLFIETFYGDANIWGGELFWRHQY